MSTQPSSGNARGPFGWRALVGLLLLLVGALLMLDVTGVLHMGSLVWGGVAVVGAALFVIVWLRNRAHWWAFIPAGALLGFAVPLLAPSLSTVTSMDGNHVGALFLAFLGLGFGGAYLANRTMWWALIPMGSLWTVAIVALLDARIPDGEPSIGSVMFFGIAATFLLVAFAPGGHERMRPWALIPAFMLALVGVLIAGSYTMLLNLIGPLTLMAIGIGLLLNFIFRRRS